MQLDWLEVQELRQMKAQLDAYIDIVSAMALKVSEPAMVERLDEVANNMGDSKSNLSIVINQCTEI